MAPVEESRREVMGRVFNAFWREEFAQSRRFARVGGLDGGTFAVVKLHNGVEIMGRLDGSHSLDRVTTSSPYYARFLPAGTIETIPGAKELADLFPGSADSLARLCEEVDQSYRNMTLFLSRRESRLKEIPSSRGKGALARVFSKARVRGCCPEEYLESWVLRGHALHPGTKTRLGFSGSDLERYSPELGCQISLRLLAVRKTHLIDSRSMREDFRCPPAWLRAFRKAADRRSVSLADYEVMTVHPWQWNNVIQSLFKSELKNGVIVPLDCFFKAQPLASLRTVAPVGDPRAPQIKLPLAIQATSVPRTITAPTVENSPRITDLLHRILERTPDLARLVSLSPETRGVHFWEPGAPPSDPVSEEKARHLTMLLRRRPEWRRRQWLVPNVILTELSPIDGRPFVCELVEKSGGDALVYFYDFALLSSRVSLAFLAGFGLGIEAHAQNTLTYHLRGRPVSWVIRDFGGMRIDRRALREAGHEVELHPGTLIATRDDLELVSSFHHSWLQGNAAPLAAALSNSFGVPEEQLWRAARDAVRTAWSEQRGVISSTRSEKLERVIFRPRIMVKALTRMRLSNEHWRDEFCEVDNPLAGGAA